jgi:uncharacterized protein
VAWDVTWNLTWAGSTRGDRFDIIGRCFVRPEPAMPFPLPVSISRAVARLSLILILILPGGLAAAADLEPLQIVAKSGVHTLSVELAQTDAQRQQGLMYRKSLPEGQGMLFDFAPAREVTMWMRNTYVSLDMIFIRADGRIHRIAESTTPLSEATISSRGPVVAVLEVVAGTAKKLGISPGDEVAHSLFMRR